MIQSLMKRILDTDYKNKSDLRFYLTDALVFTRICCKGSFHNINQHMASFIPFYETGRRMLEC